MEMLIVIIVTLSIHKWWIQKKLGRKMGWLEYARYSPKKDTEVNYIDIDFPNDSPPELVSAYRQKNFDQMRFILQKIAYMMTSKGVSEREKHDFKKIVTFFSSKDPLLYSVLECLLPVIKAQEGILQSKIYPYVPQYSIEEIRYVLYFAHELGFIYREKKGRSYALFPGAFEVEA